MKKHLLLSSFLFPLLCFSQVGIKTDTPKKTLHVNGSLQVVNELNVGGDSTTAGSAGTSGQFLISQGPGVAPQWTSVTIPVLDANSYKLKGVYNFDLFDVFSNTNGNYLTLGSFNNIVIGNPNNFVVIEFQTSSSVISLASGEGMSYIYRLSGNNGITSNLSPFFYIFANGFNPVNNVVSYKFFLVNLATNTYNLTLEAMRSNTTGTSTGSKYLHFNRTYSDANNFVINGKAIVYVYEK